MFWGINVKALLDCLYWGKGIWILQTFGINGHLLPHQSLWMPFSSLTDSLRIECVKARPSINLFSNDLAQIADEGSFLSVEYTWLRLGLWLHSQTLLCCLGVGRPFERLQKRAALPLTPLVEGMWSSQYLEGGLERSGVPHRLYC